MRRVPKAQRWLFWEFDVAKLDVDRDADTFSIEASISASSSAVTFSSSAAHTYALTLVASPR